MDNYWNIVLAVLLPLLTLFLGYFVGSVKFFREHQLKTYGEILPDILKYTFDPQAGIDEKAFNAALSNIWLYASRDVALKLDKAVSCTVDPSRGDFYSAMKSAIIAVRTDIQPWWRGKKRKIEENELKHFYFKARQ